MSDEFEKSVSKITNILVEKDNKLIPIKDLPKIEYEEFLELIHRLRLAYITVVGRND